MTGWIQKNGLNGYGEKTETNGVRYEGIFRANQYSPNPTSEGVSNHSDLFYELKFSINYYINHDEDLGNLFNVKITQRKRNTDETGIDEHTITKVLTEIADKSLESCSETFEYSKAGIEATQNFMNDLTP